MNTIRRVNDALAQIVASLNVAAPVVAVLTSAAAGLSLGGVFGLIAGVVLGTVLAGVLCGLFALLIDVRATCWPSLSRSAADPFRAVLGGSEGHLSARRAC